jgi:hypothetical protein
MGVFNTPFSSGNARFNSLGFAVPLPEVASMWQSPGAVTYGNSVTETTLTTGTPALGTLTIPAGYLQAGTMLRIVIFGDLGTDAVIPTLRLQAKLGGTAVWDQTAVSLGAVQLTGAAFRTEIYLGCTVAGAAGTVVGNGITWVKGAVVGLSAATGNSTAINTTGALALTVTAIWGTQAALNTLTVSSVVVEIMG